MRGIARTRRERCFTDSGAAKVSAQGDEDTTDLYVTVGEDAAPTDPTAASNDGAVSGRSGAVDTGVAISVGSEAVVKVVAADSGGGLGPVQTYRKRRGVGQVTKTWRRDAAMFFPWTESVTWSYSLTDLGLRAGTTGSDEWFVAPLSLPAGVTVTTVRARFNRDGTDDIAYLDLRRRTDSGGALSTIAELDATTETGAFILEDTSPNHVVDGDSTYAFRLNLKGDDDFQHATFYWVEVEYEASDVDQAI